jgi:hypothetical protein
MYPDPVSDPAYYFDADPDPFFHFDADPDPESTKIRWSFYKKDLDFRLVEMAEVLMFLQLGDFCKCFAAQRKPAGEQPKNNFDVVINVNQQRCAQESSDPSTISIDYYDIFPNQTQSIY